MATRLNPYLGFGDNARQAIEFYRSVFGGELTISTFGESGLGDAAEADKVMHSQLETSSGFTLMASDTPSGMPSQSGNGSISLSGDDDAELRGYWEKLSDGGTVIEDLQVAPWGDAFGQVKDRFGINWLVNIAGSGSQG